jgi:hypothetical protein
MDGRTPHKVLTGNTPDISDLIQHDWYDYVWYWDSAEPEPGQKEKIGPWIGPAHKVGQGLLYWILTAKCSIIARTIVRAVNSDELTADKFNNAALQLSNGIQERIGENVKDMDAVLIEGEIGVVPDDIFDDYEDNDDSTPLDKRFDCQEADNFTPEELDKYLLANVMLPRGYGLLKGQVARHKWGLDGNPIGTADRNPILDTK